ncbi:MAG: DUF2181 domain-containing protein [Thermoleophilia bacterium]|nr:DUF2181 domain-containing protein [Thermoleophilia bacterium]
MTGPVRHRVPLHAADTAKPASPRDADSPRPKPVGRASHADAPKQSASDTSGAPAAAGDQAHDGATALSSPAGGAHAAPARHDGTINSRGERIVRSEEDRDAPRTTDRTGQVLDAEAQELSDLGFETRHGSRLNPFDEHGWDPANDDLTKAKNAHRTNTAREMREAIDEGYNWFEGDLRMTDDGTPVMAHDSDNKGDGLTLDEWLAIGDSSERGMKVDVKEAEAIPKLLDALERSGIPDGRIMINVAAGQVDSTAVQRIRERFPDAWLALNPTIREGRGYSDADLRQITDMADAAGGRVTFPIRWDIASDKAITALAPHGKVSIWTAKSHGTPDNRGRATHDLRSRGVEGVIDLGDPLSLKEQAIEHLLDIWESAPSRAVRSVPGRIADGASTAWHAGTSLATGAARETIHAAGGALDAARGAASHIPGIGGLFD